MKGSVLSFDIQTSAGIISDIDGKRYSFLSSQWQSNDVHPTQGVEVDFEINEDSAISIFALKKVDNNADVKKEAEGILNHYINGFRNYANFQERATRSAFWYFQLVSFIVSIILTAVSAGVLGLLYSLAVLIPSLAIGARRLHDTNRSGWWQLIILIPLIGIIVLIIFWAGKTKEEQNKFDIN
jgi:uncharacterized membrane protein YhaH (DUF805 family)